MYQMNGRGVPVASVIRWSPVTTSSLYRSGASVDAVSVLFCAGSVLAGVLAGVLVLMAYPASISADVLNIRPLADDVNCVPSLSALYDGLNHRRDGSFVDSSRCGIICSMAYHTPRLSSVM